MTQHTALIIGAAGGICSELSRRLADKSERLVLFDRDDAAVKKLATELSDITEVEVIVGDILDVESAEHQIKSLEGDWTPSILVNGTGGDTRVIPVTELDEDFIRQSVAENLVPVLTATRLCVPAMKEAGYGRIVNFSSAGGRTYSHFNNAAYVAAKAAVIGFTKQAAYELAPWGVTVNVVAHGPIATDRVAGAWERRPADQKAAVLSKIPMGRMGTVSEAAGSVAHFCSEESGYSTGTVTDVNGGIWI
ncbi:SDR family NAD(P)-dependent oxidoreductase [Gordonia sp. CPCC 205333]|uniref:SDR family NAD(P)-dependent oxidoreductase n=1 Tax=Gordonia sp. CPCC 205333 TaxID=3140790 RepID=UPI003AF39DA5